MAYRRKGLFFWLRLVFAGLGVVSGLVGSFCFGLVYKNVHCAVWSFLSAVWAAMVLFLHVSVYRDISMSIQIRFFMKTLFLGLLGASAGIIAFGFYLTAGIQVRESGVKVDGHFIVTTWTMLLFKWGLTLAVYSSSYKKGMLRELANDCGGIAKDGIINST